MTNQVQHFVDETRHDLFRKNNWMDCCNTAGAASSRQTYEIWVMWLMDSGLNFDDDGLSPLSSVLPEIPGVSMQSLCRALRMF